MLVGIKRDTDLGETIFRIVMWWRVFYGFAKFLLGFVLLYFVGFPIVEFFEKIIDHGLQYYTSDLFYAGADKLFSHFSSHVTYFLASYFIFWGVIDVSLSINLLQKKLWAFPLSMYLISVFMVYEVYRFFHTHSFILLSIIVIDFFILYLIHYEYQKLLLEQRGAKVSESA